MSNSWQRISFAGAQRTGPKSRLARSATDRRVNATCNAPWGKIAERWEPQPETRANNESEIETEPKPKPKPTLSSSLLSLQRVGSDGSATINEPTVDLHKLQTHTVIQMGKCSYICVCVCMCLYLCMLLYMCALGQRLSGNSCRPSAAMSAHCNANLSVATAYACMHIICLCVCVYTAWNSMGTIYTKMGCKTKWR